MNKISVRIPKGTHTGISVTLNGFVFKLEKDGFYYASIFPKQWHYISKIIKDVEKKEYLSPKKRTRKPKVDVLPIEG